jgi:hypothetical protein
MVLRQAFARVLAKQRRRQIFVICALLGVLITVGTYSYLQHRAMSKQNALARDLFYAIKSIDLEIAHVERLVAESSNTDASARTQALRTRRRQLESSYDSFLANLKTYESKLDPHERLILRVARIFGECEIEMPPGFVDEVKTYITKWQSSNRLRLAIRRAEQKKYIGVITKELLAQGLPPQLIYVALQESNFEEYVSGPVTRKGIAKGMWQFIPETAARYGLRIGPLAEFRRPDPSDDRHKWPLATKAAAEYMKDLYTTEAQASALLVMACYNWGEDHVLPLVKQLPLNPRERNFWQLLGRYGDKLPKETYEYVLYIVSAAVILEDPRLFGFDFDNPISTPIGNSATAQPRIASTSSKIRRPAGTSAGHEAPERDHEAMRSRLRPVRSQIQHCFRTRGLRRCMLDGNKLPGDPTAGVRDALVQELLQVEYLAAENRILRAHAPARLWLADAERATLADIEKRVGRKGLANVADVAKSETIFGCWRKLVAQKFNGSKHKVGSGSAED